MPRLAQGPQLKPSQATSWVPAGPLLLPSASATVPGRHVLRSACLHCGSVGSPWHPISLAAGGTGYASTAAHCSPARFRLIFEFRLILELHVTHRALICL